MALVKKQQFVVAVLMGVFLYPLLFDNTVFQGDKAPQIPVPLPVPSVPFSVSQIEKPLPALPEEPVGDEVLAAKDNAVPELDDDFIPMSWTLQLTDFSKQENAESLVGTLRRAGYHAYLRTMVLQDGKPVVRVYVGPVLVRSKAESLLAEMNKVYKLEGWVVRFRP